MDSSVESLYALSSRTPGARIVPVPDITLVPESTSASLVLPLLAPLAALGRRPQIVGSRDPVRGEGVDS